MHKTLSRTVICMFLFDVAILLLSTFFVSKYCHITHIFINTLLVTITGLVSLYLKGNYKIREFNVTAWNIYRLFEGVIFAHIPSFILFVFASKIILPKFAIYNIGVIFISLLIWTWRLV